MSQGTSCPAEGCGTGSGSAAAPERGAFSQDVDAALDMDSSGMGLAEGAATVRMGVLRS